MGSKSQEVETQDQFTLNEYQHKSNVSPGVERHPMSRDDFSVLVLYLSPTLVDEAITDMSTCKKPTLSFFLNSLHKPFDHPT